MVHLFLRGCPLRRRTQPSIPRKLPLKRTLPLHYRSMHLPSHRRGIDGSIAAMLTRALVPSADSYSVAASSAPRTRSWSTWRTSRTLRYSRATMTMSGKMSRRRRCRLSFDQQRRPRFVCARDTVVDLILCLDCTLIPGSAPSMLSSLRILYVLSHPHYMFHFRYPVYCAIYCLRVDLINDVQKPYRIAGVSLYSQAAVSSWQWGSRRYIQIHILTQVDILGMPRLSAFVVYSTYESHMAREFSMFLTTTLSCRSITLRLRRRHVRRRSW